MNTIQNTLKQLQTTLNELVDTEYFVIKDYLLSNQTQTLLYKTSITELDRLSIANDILRSVKLLNVVDEPNMMIVINELEYANETKEEYISVIGYDIDDYDYLLHIQDEVECLVSNARELLICELRDLKYEPAIAHTA